MRSDVTVVVRSVGERTETACLDLLRRQVPEEAIHLIHEYPFSQAVRRNFEIGIEENRPWTMGLDADVLLFEGAVDHLIGLAEEADESNFEFQGRIFDKWMSVARKGGPHLFRTALLEQAIELVPEEGESLRPESDVFLAMAEKGHPYVHRGAVYGLHDFGQYKRDIYRSVFVHARKNHKRASQLEQIFKTFRKRDDDFRIALKALKDGIRYRGRMDLNARTSENLVQEALKGESEKSGEFKIDPIPDLESVPEDLLPKDALTITEKYPDYLDYSRKARFKRTVKRVLGLSSLGH